jgi:hypothetical protein
MVRVTFRGSQKKTKKNANLRDPKFFEMLRFTVWTGGDNNADGKHSLNAYLDDQITI